MAQFNPKHPSIEAHPVAHLILDSVTNFDTLPEFVRLAYQSGSLTFGRRDIRIENPDGSRSLAEWDDWIIDIEGRPVAVAETLFHSLFTIPAQQP